MTCASTWRAASKTLLALVLVLAFAGAMPPSAHSQVPQISLVAEDRSWENDPAVQEMKDHLIIGGELWNAVTNQPVASVSPQGPAAWIVAGRPDLLVFRAGSAFGFVRSAPLVISPGHRQQPPKLEICLQARLCRQYEIQTRTPGPLLHKDLRRVIYFQDDALWRAEVDWGSNRFVNHREVTPLGVSISNLTPLHWFENTLLLRTGRSRQHPVLRVDLTTGQRADVAPNMVFDADVFANPSGSRLCASHGELLACYHVPTSEFSRLSLFETADGWTFRGSMRGVHYQDVPHDAWWLSDETLLLRTLGRAGVAGEARFIRVDFRNGRADALFALAPPQGTVIRDFRLDVLPGRRHVAVWFTTEIHGPATAWRSRRISVEDGAVVPLPGHVSPDGMWLDGNRYVYGVPTGDLDEIGTWIYEIPGGHHTKVCGLPASIRWQPTEAPAAVFLPHRSILYFQSSGQGGGVFRADLAAGGCELVSSGRSHPVPLLTPPIDLRSDLSGDQLWSPARPAAAPVAQAIAGDGTGDVAGDEATGLERVLRATDGLPAEVREAVQAAYRHAEGDLVIRTHYDEACYTLAYLDWYSEQPEERVRHHALFRNQHDRFAHCVDRERIVSTNSERAARMQVTRVRTGVQLTEDQIERIARCTGETVADRYMANPLPVGRHIGHLRANAMGECQREHGN